MNKADISGRVAARLRLSKAEAEAAVDTVFEAIGESLAREEAVRIAGFGTFATRNRDARTGRNRGTGESVAIPASKASAFKASKALCEVVNRGPKPEAEEQPDDGNRRRRGRPEAGRELEVSAWPGGIEPVRSTLDAESVRALGTAPAAVSRALVLANDLSEEDLRESTMARNALILLNAVAGSAFVWLTDKGNLQRETVAAMRSAMSWPGMEAVEEFRCTHGTLRSSGRYSADGALESGGVDVRGTDPRAAPLVRADGVAGTAGHVRGRVLAQDRAFRPLPVVRRPVRGRPHEGALAGHDEVAPSGGERDRCRGLHVGRGGRARRRRRLVRAGRNRSRPHGENHLSGSGLLERLAGGALWLRYGWRRRRR